MAGGGIDLSQLPAPAVVEALDFEAARAALVADFQARFPDLADALESDPVVKLLEVVAYLEVLLRQRINEAARACMLAYATGSDLDQLAAWWGVARRSGDTDATVRQRTQESLAALTCAGTRAAYRWHAREASTEIRDVGIDRPIDGTVRVTLLSTVAPGTASPALCTLVAAALDDEDVRPLCDTVIVQTAAIVDYTVEAVLYLAPGPDSGTVLAAAQAAAESYVASVHRVGARVARSGLDAALHRPGVVWVDLAHPAADLVCTAEQAPHCTALTLGAADAT